MKSSSGNHIEPTLYRGFGERRLSSRFPLSEDVTYKFRNEKLTGAGSGKCLNISSGGVFFTTTSRLPIGRTVELSLNWPALLDGACALKFIASGPVVRSEEDRAAMRIDRYEFRTRSTRPGLAASLSSLRRPVDLALVDSRVR